jgi:hypothetical protein
LVIDEELCASLIDWKKAFDRVNWTKLMQILRELGLARKKIDQQIVHGTVSKYDWTKRRRKV